MRSSSTTLYTNTRSSEYSLEFALNVVVSRSPSAGTGSNGLGEAAAEEATGRARSRVSSWVYTSVLPGTDCASRSTTHREYCPSGCATPPAPVPSQLCWPDPAIERISRSSPERMEELALPPVWASMVQLQVSPQPSPLGLQNGALNWTGAACPPPGARETVSVYDPEPGLPDSSPSAYASSR